MSTQKKCDELVKWSDAEIFAYAITYGLVNGQKTGSSPGLKLVFSFCYGCGYSDTHFWTIPYTVDEQGFPVFDKKAKDTLIMILSEEYLASWNLLNEAKAQLEDARKVHENFMSSLHVI